MRAFRRTTMGHVLVMGRRTFESIGRPLPGRTTVVVTGTSPWPPDGQPPPGLLVAVSFDAALRLAAAVDGETFVQGGARIYAEALPVADRLLLTWVYDDPRGDTYFPPVEWSQWEESGSARRFAGGAWSTYLRHDRPSAEAIAQPGSRG